MKHYSGFIILAAALLGAGVWWLWEREPAAIGQRVVVLGLEGLDRPTLNRLVDEGRLPAFARMRNEGTWGGLEAAPPLSDPACWTSMATGVTPLHHAVFGYFMLPEDGAIQPAASDGRAFPAMWNVASYHGRRALLVNWPATWPAEKIHGAVVSDLWFLSPEQKGSVYPEKLRSTLPAVENRADEAEKFFLSGASASSLSPEARAKWNAFAGLFAAAEHQREVFEALYSREKAELSILRLSLAGEAAMLFGDYTGPAVAGLPEADRRILGEVPYRAYEYLDEILAGLMQNADEHTVIFAVSGHGCRLGDDKPTLNPDSAATLEPEERFRSQGVMAAWGANVLPGPIGMARQTDLAPTVLAMLRVPLSIEFDGKVMSGLFADASFLRNVKEAKDYSYIKNPPALASVPADPAPLRVYLEAAGFRRPSGGDWKAWETSMLWLQQGQAFITAKKPDEAREAMKQAHMADPQAAAPLLYLGMLESERNVTGPALEHLAGAIERRPGYAAAYLESARIYGRMGQWSQYWGMLELARRTHADRMDLYLLQTQQRLKSNELAAAEAALREGIRNVASVSEKSYLCNMLALLIGNDPERFLETEDFFREAARLRPDWNEPRANLGMLLASLGEFERAVPELEAALRMEPNHVAALNALGLAYISLRRAHEARHCFTRSLALNPRQPEIEARLRALPQDS